MNKYGSIHNEGLDKDIITAFTNKKILLVGKTFSVLRDVGNDEYEGRIEGGLTFILEDVNTKQKTKVILGYTELGEWLENEEKIT